MNRVTSTYMHSLEGRLRIRLPKIKGAMREALEVDLRLQQVTGVEDVFANHVTGNVLIYYNPGVIGQREIISFLMEGGYLPQPTREHRTTDSESAVAGLATSLAVAIMEVTLSRLIGTLI